MQQISKRRCDSLCQDHAFKICCKNSLNYTKLDINAIFCPKYHRPPKQPQTIFPSFNNDKKYYTSGFILQVDKKALIINDNQILHQHNKYVKDAIQKNGKILFPKPSKRHNVCGVCKIQYTNYFKHIIGEQHKLKLVCNEYNKQILSIQTKYQDFHPKEIPQYPIHIIKIKKQKVGQQQSTLGQVENSAKELRQQMLNNSKGMIGKEIEAMIISSDDQKQQSTQQKCYQQRERQLSSSSQSHTKSKISKFSKDEDEDDSVQIVNIKRPKNSKEKTNKHKKSEKNNKHKNKKEKSKHRKKQSRDSSQSQSSSQVSQKKRGSIGKKGPDLMPEVKRPLFKKKQTQIPQRRPVQILIQKSQIQNPQLDDEMQKILNNIVGGIKNCPPAQPRRKYQKGSEASDLRSLVIGGNALSLMNLSQLKSVSSFRTNDKTQNTSTSSTNNKEKNVAKTIELVTKQQRIQNSDKVSQNKQAQNVVNKSHTSKIMLPNKVVKPNPILQKLNLSNLNDKNKIGLTTKRRINQNMKPSTTKIQKCIDLDSEQIIQMSCRQKEKKKTELELIMRYDEKKLINQLSKKQSVSNGIQMDENHLDQN